MNIDKNEFRKYAVGHRHVQSLQVDNYVARIENSIPMAMTPYITEERELRVAQMDVFSRLMMDRIIFLGEAIDDNTANIIQAQLLFLQSADPKKDIQMYINSPGGSVYAGFGIYDTMHLISPNVATICTGMAASMAAVLLCSGAAGKRAALKHSRVMIHQPLGGVQGPASDIEITAREVLKVKKEIYEVISKHSGQEYQKGTRRIRQGFLDDSQ
jgi:ATP-dependent Clp protease protease subunit